METHTSHVELRQFPIHFAAFTHERALPGHTAAVRDRAFTPWQNHTYRSLEARRMAAMLCFVCSAVV